MTYAVATSVIFCPHWQLDILKAVLRQTSKTVVRLARCPQYLEHVAKSSIRWIFRKIVPATLLQNLPLATHATFWFHSPYNIRKMCCVASARKMSQRGSRSFNNSSSTLYVLLVWKYWLKSLGRNVSLYCPNVANLYQSLHIQLKAKLSGQ